MIQEHVQHAAGEAAEKFKAGEVIIEHVSNSPIDHPLIHLPTVAGIDFSVTKHVLMLWLVAGLVFTIVTWTVRRYLKQDRLVPSGFMGAVEAMVEFIRDSIVLPNVGKKWVNTWTPLVLTLFIFILSANAIGLFPIFEVLALLNRYILHTGPESFVSRLMITPARLRSKKPSERRCRWPKSFMRRSARIRSPTQPVRYVCT